MDLNGKCVLLGVSGGIAAYKTVSYTHLVMPYLSAIHLP